MNTSSQIQAHFVDIFNRKIFPAIITIADGKIENISPCETASPQYILPGFIDAHIHIESSMLTPPYFAQAALPHGTVATISDPHEIANVCGLDGVLYMLEAAKNAPLKFHFGAPSCVPATSFETAGATLNANDIEVLMKREDIFYLSEVMNFPAVLSRDAEMMQKLDIAKQYQKPIDGHAPGMKYPTVKDYFAAGISTDHECFSLEEALDKIAVGCKILIREGSAAKNFEALKPLFNTHPQALMFCSDDLHPDDLLKGHINLLAKRAIQDGFELFDVLFAACIHPALHYNMNVGLMRIGDAADFILVRDLKDFEVLATYIKGEQVAAAGEATFSIDFKQTINQFSIQHFNTEDLKIKTSKPDGSIDCAVIEALDGQLITRKIIASLKVKDGVVLPSIEKDILKIIVVNRYQTAPAMVAFIKNFGLRSAAIASTVAHDSHNIVAVGSDDEYLEKAINALIETQGGIVYADAKEVAVLPLEVAGLMTNQSAATAGQAYEKLTQKAKANGCSLHAPFMTLSFMALPVIPQLKITDLGLFDTSVFNFTDLLL